MRIFDELQSISLEGDAGIISTIPTTKVETEEEYICYATIGSINGLEAADHKEMHEDLIVKGENGGKFRVRTITTDAGIQRFLTMKSKPSKNSEKGMSYCTEYTIPVDEAFSNGIVDIAEKLIHKVRYVFNSEKVELTYTVDEEEKVLELPSIKYEVDVFEGMDDMCKIEIEMQDIFKALKANPEISDKAINLTIKVSHLPFKPMGIFSQEDKEKQHQFWERVYADKEPEQPLDYKKTIDTLTNTWSSKLDEDPAVPEEDQDESEELEGSQDDEDPIVPEETEEEAEVPEEPVEEEKK